MSHEHRQDPERFYDDEGEAYEGEDEYPLSLYWTANESHARTWTFSPSQPKPMTRRQTYRHYRDDGDCRRWDSVLAALMSAEARPRQFGHAPTFTVERTDS